MAEVLLVEDSPSDANLAGIAIALRRPGIRVQEARHLIDALRILASPTPPQLTILGWRALTDAPAKLATEDRVIVGFASNVSETERRRALEAGVRAIYARPQEWGPYCDSLERLLNDWLPAKQQA